PRKFFDDMIEFAQSVGSKGLGYIGWQDGSVRSPIAKFLDDAHLEELCRLCSIENGDVVFFIADTAEKSAEIGSHVLRELGKRLDLVRQDRFEFCWIVDYPMYERNPVTGAIQFSHNPFSMPQGGMEALENEDPLKILAWQYDLVCNGVELSSGALRNYKPDVMVKAFEIGGYSREELEKNFHALFDAFHYGTPPHGGIAPGIDRIVMLLAGVESIREVIAFPMNQQAQDLLMGAPGPVKEEQLRELHIRIRKQHQK
ncbi:MAG: aspartate--tRNA ligase, partial [Lentisphaerae bacterium]